MPKPLTADEAKLLQLISLHAKSAGEQFPVMQLVIEFEEAGGTFDEFAHALLGLIDRQYLQYCPSPLFAALTLLGVMETHSARP